MGRVQIYRNGDFRVHPIASGSGYDVEHSRTVPRLQAAEHAGALRTTCGSSSERSGTFMRSGHHAGESCPSHQPDRSRGAEACRLTTEWSRRAAWLCDHVATARGSFGNVRQRWHLISLVCGEEHMVSERPEPIRPARDVACMTDAPALTVVLIASLVTACGSRPRPSMREIPRTSRLCALAG